MGNQTPPKMRVSRNHFRLAVLCAGLLLAAAAPAFAQEPPAAPAAAPAAPAGPVAWSSLSPEQQRVLGSMSNQWGSLPPERQQALAQGSQRWLSMSPDQRDQARDRFSHWQSLPPEQRHALRHVVRGGEPLQRK